MYNTNNISVLFLSNYTDRKEKSDRKIKSILSSDVNAPSVRACFHLTAFYSG